MRTGSWVSLVAGLVAASVVGLLLWKGNEHERAEGHVHDSGEGVEASDEITPVTEPRPVVPMSTAPFEEAPAPEAKPAPVPAGAIPALRALVLDADRRPLQGIGVIIREWDERRQVWRRSAIEVSGADGLAAFARVNQRRGMGSPELTLEAPFLEPPIVTLAPSSLPEAPVELIVPPTGSVCVLLHDGEGRPCPDDVQVVVTAHASPESLEALGPAVRFRSTGADHPPPRLMVGLGLHFRIRVEALDVASGPRPVEVTETGPTQRGEARDLVVVYGVDRFPVLVGRFIRRDGSPVPPCHVAAIERIDPDLRRDSLPWQKVAVLEGGAFRLAVRKECPPNGTHRCELQELAPDGNFKDSPERAWVDLTEPYPGGETSIGDVVLDRGGVLCSGIVVDQDGQPVAGAGVSIYLSSPGGWTGLPGDTVAGDDGSFKVLWEEPIEPGQTGLGVCASHPMASHGTNIVSFERGQEGLRLMVDVGGVIAGSFSPEEDVTILRPVLSMQRVGRSERQSAGIGSQFRVRAEPGLLTVVVLADGGAGDELLRLDNLLVERGVVTQDPRLQGMLFSANLQKATLRILDEGGQPLLVRATVQDIDQKHQWYSGRDGRVTLSRRLPGDWNLHVVAPGFRSIELRGVREDRDVVLRRGPLVRLEASDHAAIEALGAAVFVNLKEAGTESNRRLHMFGLDDVVPAIGGGTLRVENVGPHHVTWFVERQNPGNTTSRFTVSQETPETVHVADMETLQAFIVTPPLDALRKKIEEMKKE